MNLELMDYFIEKLYQKYEGTYFLARHLYKRWSVENFSSKDKIEAFLNSDLVKGAIFVGEINSMKRYSEDLRLTTRCLGRYESLGFPKHCRWRQSR